MMWWSWRCKKESMWEHWMVHCVTSMWKVLSEATALISLIRFHSFLIFYSPSGLNLDFLKDKQFNHW